MTRSSLSSRAAVVVALALLAAALPWPSAAVKPLSEFESGMLTFYGGQPDGMDPSSPSYGAKEVRVYPTDVSVPLSLILLSGCSLRCIRLRPFAGSLRIWKHPKDRLALLFRRRHLPQQQVRPARAP